VRRLSRDAADGRWFNGHPRRSFAPSPWIALDIRWVKARRDALAPLASGIASAFIYGSMAKGTETASSDVDVMVIGTVGFEQVAEAVAAAQGALGREVNLSVYAPDEFKSKVAKKHHFLINVLKNPKMYLIGDRDGLEGLAGERLAD
jgi:predicted nucleotidyltransferase